MGTDFDMAGDTLSLLEPDPEMLDNVLEVLFENYSSIAEVFRIFATSPKGKTPCSELIHASRTHSAIAVGGSRCCMPPNFFDH
jgi:hypothetical protein